MKKLDLKTHDLIAGNIEGLKELFPEAFAEGKIDFDALRLLLGDSVEKEKERFGLSWPGKQDAIKMALVQNTGTLRPKKEESKDWDTTGNLFIEGDNLEVLRVLLETYRGKVKMIYIDPPYNTGTDRVYKDDFADNVINYKEKAEENLKSNAKTEGRYHSKWLSMMYPRLKLAKEFLKDDGVIFVSIDDNEVQHLRDVMDEIFGEENFVEIFSWVRTETPSNLAKRTKKTVEYILCYQKTNEISEFKGIVKSALSANPLLNQTNPEGILIFPVGIETNIADQEIKPGIYGAKAYQIELLEPIIVENGSFKNEVKLKSRFRWSQENLNREIASGTIIRIPTRNLVPSYERATYGKEVPSNLINYEVGVETNEQANDYLIKLLGGQFFDHPKPVSLISYLTGFLTESGDVILDFFAGSGTTAQAVMKLNQEDGGNRKFILVQIPEATPEDSEARKAGYKTIDAISKERIRRAGEKVKTDSAEKLSSRETPLDIGFKVFALDTSNLSQWNEKTNDLQGSLLEHIQGIKADRMQDDLLYEVLLKYGIDLSTPIVTETINEKRIYNVGEGYLLVCLEEGINLKTIEIIAAKKPTRVVFLDKSFATDIVKLNAEQTLKKAGVEDLRVL